MPTYTDHLSKRGFPLCFIAGIFVEDSSISSENPYHQYWADLTPTGINQYCPDQIYSVSTWLYHEGTVSRIDSKGLFWSWKKAQLTPHNHRSRIPNMTVTKGFYIMSGILMRSLKRNPNKQSSFPSPPSAGASGFILFTSQIIIGKTKSRKIEKPFPTFSFYLQKVQVGGVTAFSICTC